MSPRRLLLLVPVVLTLMTSRAEASHVRHHKAITRRALLELGWTDRDAVERVALSNVATDLTRLPWATRILARPVFLRASPFIDPVQRMTCGASFNGCGKTRGFHFNSLYSHAAIERRWRDLDLWIGTVCEELNGGGDEVDPAAYETLLGVVSHAVQDFYAHSNWVGIIDLYTPGQLVSTEFPTWEEAHDPGGLWMDAHPGVPLRMALDRMRLSNGFLSGDDEMGGLQTGRVRGEIFFGTGPWRHRHKSGAERAVVHDLACRTTRFWVQRIDARLKGLQPSERAAGQLRNAGSR